MTTLITGGAGFIGSSLAARLIALGREVVILDNFNDYYDPTLKRINIDALDGKAVVVEGDIRDEALVERIFSNNGITHVVHLAAMAGVRFSVERGPLYADVNTRGSTLMMEIARKHKASLFIQASTSSVYGNASQIPFTEEDVPDFPLAPYPASKRAAELFGYSYHHLFDLNITVLRFFNVYGPRGRPDMMPIRVIEAIRKEEAIKLFDGGRLQRDWTYIDDTVDGIIAALERPLGYAVINLGFGSAIPLTDFITIYEDLIGKYAVTENVPAPLSEPRILYCDNKRARELLGFTPKVPLADGLARTWAWYRSHYQM